MKSVIKNQENAIESSYPCLKIYNNDSKLGVYVVLFTEPKNGVVVYSENQRVKVGDDNKTYSETASWAEECFSPFNGTIELSNN